MELLLRRQKTQPDHTHGDLFVRGAWECHTLEDEYRINKVYGETRIPSGRYLIELRTEGGMHGRYKERFAPLHRGMLWLRGVPNFEFVYIHIGNDDEDTDGCILVGKTRSGDKILRSAEAYTELYTSVVAAMDSGEVVWIIIQDEDGDIPVDAPT